MDAADRRDVDRDSALRRLERSVRRRVELWIRLRRVADSTPAILQITVAATSAYLFSRFVLGHPVPLLSLTVTITALGFQRDARPRRVLETVVGILVGITLAEVLLLVVGGGVWQLIVVLLVTLVIARFVSSSAAFAVSAGVQSMLVLLLPVTAGTPFARSLDGLVGGAVALIVTALVPRDLRGVVERDARRLLSILDEALDALATSLLTADEPAADLALTRLRRTQPLVDDWTSSLETAAAIARISPFLRRQLPELRDSARVRDGADLAARHLRVIARRVDFLVRDGVPRPVLAGLTGEVAEAMRSLPTDPRRSSAILTDVATRLSPTTVFADAQVVESVVLLLLRPLVVDLLVATGSTLDEARRHLPAV